MDSGRKVVAMEFISADGVIESPHEWHFPYFGEDMGELLNELTGDMSALLLGRVTYEDFAASWPQRSDDEPGAKEMNETPKYAVTTTLTSADWQNSTLITSDVASQVRQLKEQPGGPIVIWGSATLVRWLLSEGLLDELHLFVHPIVVGDGKRLFDGARRTLLEVVASHALSLGTMHIAYAPAADATAKG